MSDKKHSPEGERLLKLLENIEDWKGWRDYHSNRQTLQHKKSSISITTTGFFLTKRVSISVPGCSFNSTVFNKYDNKKLKRVMKEVFYQIEQRNVSKAIEPIKDFLKKTVEAHSSCCS